MTVSIKSDVTAMIPKQSPDSLKQGWATGGPRAGSGPRGPLNRPLACHLH